ncbi:MULTISPECIES: hypothetical protein [Xanthobacter]|uniref:Uncharacterized protein n=1 Tax=Xanthobacter flavus TaxID=281 RepID=A0A9W6CL40_XANFL|nr:MULTISPECIES: hypothetical protein [Xanthobacter]MDR6334011.1 hypothetical protein [Xanthobacter flavus]UJX44346.1 hypothetical protein D7006_06105 [Xanthobacter sp. YC-JY1]GLI22729.1 hypothetical protein XFLAVUS301_24030 [Xanthobacter flavus]
MTEGKAGRGIGTKVAVAIGIVAVLGAGGWFGFAAWSRAKVRAEVDQAFAGIRAAGSKASFTDAGFDPTDRAVTVSGIAIASADGTAAVKIARLVARGSEKPIDRRVTLEALDLDGVEVTLTGDAAQGGTVSYSLPQVMIDRYNGPMTLIAAGEGGGAYGALRVALRQLAATTAAKVTIPEARVRMAPAGAPPMEATYTNLAAEGINAGAIRSLIIDRSTAAYVLPGAAPADGQGTPAKFNLRIEGLVAAQIDTAPLLLMTQPGGPAGKAADAYGRIYGKVVTGPYVISQEGGATQGGASMLMENFAIRPSAFDAGRLAKFQALVTKPPANPSVEDSRRAAELLRDTIGGLSFSTIAVTEAYTTDKGETGHVGLIRMDGLANGVLDGFVLERADGKTTEGGTGKIGRLAVRQLDFNQLAALAAEAQSPSPTTALVLFRVISGLDIKNLEVPYGEGDAKDEPVKIGNLSLSWGGSLGVLPSYVDFALTDVSGPIRPEDGEPFTYLINAGMKRATVSLGAKAFYDVNESSLTLAPITTEVKDAFRVTIETKLSDVPQSAFSDAGSFVNELPAIGAGPVTVTLTDLGLAKLMYAQFAKAAGMSEADYREQVLSLAEAFAAEMEEGMPEMAPVGAAMVSFLRNPGTLKVTAKPKGFVPLIALASSGDPTVLLETFTFEATATAP